MNNHAELMQALKNKLSGICQVVPVGSKVIYFDYPLHFNVGDQLIHMGTLEFFEKHSYKVEGYYSRHNVDIDSLSCVRGDVIIILQGGGNFGDLYPKHQKFRESIIKNFPRNKIVVLPQSIHFTNESSEDASADIFRTHTDLVIYARDENSYQTACKFSDNCFLMPDMAHYLWGTSFLKAYTYASINADEKVVLLQDRIDIESTGAILFDKYPNRVVFDWYELIPYRLYKICSALSLLSKLSKNNKLISKMIHFCWVLVSKKSISLSAKKINSYAKFVTTRLHGHIFAQLISHPNIILDNNYGKIRNYADCWTMESDIVEKGDI